MAPEAPRFGTRDPGSTINWANGRRKAADQIEHQECSVPEPVLDVVAEDPEVEHVAAEVHPAGVHEHRREDRRHICGGVSQEPGWHERPLPDERIAAAELDDEEQHVKGDQGVGDDRETPFAAVVVANGQHRTLSSLPSASPTDGPVCCMSRSNFSARRDSVATC